MILWRQIVGKKMVCVCEDRKWEEVREKRCNRVQRGEAGGREGQRGSAVKDA